MLSVCPGQNNCNSILNSLLLFALDQTQYSMKFFLQKDSNQITTVNFPSMATRLTQLYQAAFQYQILGDFSCCFTWECVQKIINFINMKNRDNNYKQCPQNYVQKQKAMLMKKRRSRKNYVRQSFKCSCGKFYLSFSAIYLHARRKHNLKLSTQENTQGYTTEQNKGYVEHIYTINQVVDEKKIQKNLKQAGTKLNELSSQVVPYELGYPLQLRGYIQKTGSNEEKSLLSQFLIFVFSQQQDLQKQKQVKIYNLPYYLNPFLLERMPKSHPFFCLDSQQGRKACQILSKFCLWLKDEKMTDLTVLKNLDS